MEEQLSDSEHQRLKSSDMLSEWLGESRFIVRICHDVDDALAILCAKRETLEEKLISKELHAVLAAYGKVLAALHFKLSTGAAPPENQLEPLRTFNYDFHAIVVDLLKALRYNLNYVEQYFEFDFCARLTQQSHFAADAEAFAERLKG